MMNPQLFFPSITEASQVGEARRLTVKLANNLGFNETETGKAALIVTEMATNLVKHATGGQLLIRDLKRPGQTGLEILALDGGPGIANIGASLRDGYSTTSTAGSGLGAIIRLSTVFDIHSMPDRGTALLAQLWSQDGKRMTETARPDRETGQLSSQLQASPIEIGAVSLPKPGEEVCGDDWAVVQQANRWLIMVADGLGHGSMAAEAAQKAVAVLLENPALTPAALLEAAHVALRSSRGAALAVAELDLESAVRFAGIGNIAGTILRPTQNHHLTSGNGIVGHEVRKYQEFNYPWSNDALLIMHSDGLTTHWNLDAYPGLIQRHPSLIAGVLYRDFNRGHDDVTVVVVK